MTDILKESNNPEITFHCKLCKENKSKESFYSYKYVIEDKIYKEKYLDYLCKDCLPFEAIEWNITESKPKINQDLFVKLFREREEIIFHEKYNIKMSDLLSRSDSLKFLNLDYNHKEWLQNKVSMGIVEEFITRTTPGNYEKGGKAAPEHEKYYKPEQITMLKYIKDNGFLIVRGQKSVIRGSAGQHNAPYQFINSNGKHFLFVNTVKKEKTCVICCNLKSFSEFDVSSVTKDGNANTCKQCASVENKTKYQSLDTHELDNRRKRQREYCKTNKDKIWSLSREQRRIYNKIRRKTPQAKIRRNLKNRIKKLMKAKKYNNLDYLNKVESGYYILPSSEKLLGIHPIKFLNYLESKFKFGMNWGNYGTKWEIDHIKCIDSFDLNNKEDLMAINHHSNLIPMWKTDNQIKHNKKELCPIKDKELLDKYPELSVLIK